MPCRRVRRTLLVASAVLLRCVSVAQEHPPVRENFPLPTEAQLSRVPARFGPWPEINSGEKISPLRGPSGSVSKLDLRVPAPAKREYDKGYELLMRKDFQKAIAHLTNAVSLFPDFVAARNALGSAYLESGKTDEARHQFADAVSLDDHLPNSYLNLGRAQLTLEDYHGAEESLRRGYLIAPLDPELGSALAFVQYMNQHYDGVLDTAREVHSRKHPGAAMVHYYAAAAWYARNNLQNAKSELQRVLQEDPKSRAAGHAREMLSQVDEEARVQPYKDRQAADGSGRTQIGNLDPSSQPAEAQPLPFAAEPNKEAAELNLKTSSVAPGTNELAAAHDAIDKTGREVAPIGMRDGNFVLRANVNEVAVLFAATDHGKSVSDLTRADVEVRDDEKVPLVITGFRNESQLPLRLGLVIDTSESITGRFSFEQRAAIAFVRQVLTGKDDLAFVIGVANSVLLVQDFTNDQQRIGHAIDQLAPAGGTALWDAVAFAAEHLAKGETGRVARMLVVISDGRDNSSAATLEEASAAAERGEVFVYTVSTGEDTGEAGSAKDGNRALRALADRSGGTAFVPSAFAGLSRMLDNLQQVIRSRYLISYKPSQFQNDGRYRTIDIAAQKDGHKLRVFARHGYYADARSAERVR